MNQKTSFNRVQMQLTEREKIKVMHVVDPGLISRP